MSEYVDIVYLHNNFRLLTVGRSVELFDFKVLSSVHIHNFPIIRINVLKKDALIIGSIMNLFY